MSVLSKKEILAAKDLKREVVDVPEWGKGAQVIIGELSALGREEFGKITTSDANKDRHYLSLALTFFIVNEDGSRVFEQEEHEALAGKSLEVLSRLFEAVKRVNILGDAIAETEKN